MGEGRVREGEKDVGHGIEIEVLAFQRKGYKLIGGYPLEGQAGSFGPYQVVPQTQRQLRIGLGGQKGILLQAGAFQYGHGRLSFDVRKMENGGGFLRRRIASAGTGEAAHQTLVTGAGVIYTEPTPKYLSVVDIPDGMEYLLDDGAFYALSETGKLSTHTHTNMGSFFAGTNGLMQPKVRGPGFLVIESDVPWDEVEIVEVRRGEDLVVDGDLVLMYDAGLKVTASTLVRGVRNAARTGEGIVYTYSGEGSVFMTPGAPIHRNLS